jgi:predicted nucleotidyltransferase
MATTFLSDEVISSTQLRTNQKHWFDKAIDGVVTIVNGKKQFVLVNREQISKLYAQKYYTDIILNYCYEIIKKNESNTLRWANFLSDEERNAFHDELISHVMKAIITDDWSSVGYLLEDWKATAEANSNPQLRDALLAEEDPSKYVKIKD